MKADLEVENKAEPMVRVASRISGVGKCVPEKVITNEYFASYLDTSDEWIRERTGIRERRWTEPDTAAHLLAVPAGRAAIEQAGLTPADIDGVIVATTTPDSPFPTTACNVQSKIGISKGFAFDLAAACSGFLYGVSMANGMIAVGQATNVLVVGVDLLSRLINPNDRTTCILFGDGAGAAVISAVKNGSDGQRGGYVEGNGATMSGIYSMDLGADGNHGGLLTIPLGTAYPLTEETVRTHAHCLTMNGREIFKHAVRAMSDSSDRVIAAAGFTAADVDYVVAHQANQRIVVALGKHMDLPSEKVPMNVEHYGNTSAASIPILLSELTESGRVKKGDLLLLTAFGGGLTWGSALVRW